ncbi:MAG: hypothetical protein HYR91_05890 [Flavobacteriia bacterium]|nr:hypothetical protein [Flavobacteriia bacterium]
MRKFHLCFLFVLASTFVFSQRDLTPSKRKNAFGKVHNLEFRNYGLQFSFGPTYMLTKQKNEVFQSPADAVRPYNYSFDPEGLVGVFAEVGMVHYPTGERKHPLFKSRLITYYDWGLGFKYLGGTEKTTINFLSPSGSITNVETGEGRYYNGYGYGRFTLHHNTKINGKIYIDNGLGLNFDYRVLNGNRNYKDASLPETQYFHKPFVAQMHYDLGVGIRFLHGSIVPGAQIPILGFYEWNKGNPSLRWYSSKYRPILFKVKIIWLLEKKKSKNGCQKGSEQDRKSNDSYMQGQ